VNKAGLEELNYPNVMSNAPTSSVHSFHKARKQFCPYFQPL